MYAFRDFSQNIQGNVFGGLTAAIVALPLALAFGITSGAGPIAGLYGAIIVGLFTAIFGGTRTQISGPTGPMTVVMTAMIAEFTAAYPDQGLTLAFSTVFLGGLIQACFGVLRLGKYIIMVPYPVISGFMTGIGLIIIALEIGPALGFESANNTIDAVRLIPEQIANLKGDALVLTSVTLAILFLWRGRLNQLFPAPLLALITVTIGYAFFMPHSEIDTIGNIPSGIPSLQWPVFHIDIIQLMLVNALMLAVLGSIDSLLTSLVADSQTGTFHHSDNELIGQGIGNAFAGLFGGLPGAGATMRTLVNIRAGGTGPASGVIHAMVLIVIVAGASALFESIPLAVLAGILIKVGLGIIDWPFIKRLNRLPLFPVFLMLLVLTLTVFVDLITAVFVGVFLKNIVIISKLSDLQLGSVVLSDGVKDIDRLSKHERKILVEHANEALLLRITGPVSYAVGRGLVHAVEQFEAPKKLLIDIESASIIGISTTMVLEDLIKKSLAKNIEVKLIGAKALPHLELERLGIFALVGKENCISNLQKAF